MKAKPDVIELDDAEAGSVAGRRSKPALGEDVAAPFRELLHGYERLAGDPSQEGSSRCASFAKFSSAPRRSGPATCWGQNRNQIPRAGRPRRAMPVTGRRGRRRAPRRRELPVAKRVGKSREPTAANARGMVGIGAKKYPVARRSWWPTAGCIPGDACPKCEGGKVYELPDPARLVRLVGQAPVGGKVYELQRLRCHLCGDVFTAEPPEEAGKEKYDATAVAMMAMMRYGDGMPGNRLEDLQQSLGIPLPASTQWEDDQRRCGGARAGLRVPDFRRGPGGRGISRRYDGPRAGADGQGHPPPGLGRGRP